MSKRLEQTPLASDEPLYSYHAFLFPFEWNYRRPTGPLLEDQTDLQRLEQLMSAPGSAWERRGAWTAPSSLLQFNEVAYFYDFVRPVLYDTGKPDSFQRHYYYRLPGPPDAAEYRIEVPSGREYKLKIDDIVVSYYDTGVGVLAFHLYNKEVDQSAPEDILAINAFGRRIYPPYFGSNTGLLGQQAFFDDADWEKGLQRTLEAKQMAQSIAILADGKVLAHEDFSSWLRDQNLNREPDLVRHLLPAAILLELELQPVLDDRMFTVCWYGNKGLAQDLTGQTPDQHYKTHDWWYQYVFVDSDGATVQNDEMKKKLLEGATNARWAGYGTFYGLSRYSFMALSGECTAHPFNRTLASHTMTIYYKIALLGLVQRACLLRFSQEVTNISQLPKDDKHIAARVGSLYKQYIRFINKIYFREVTAQEQGTELYDILQEQMWLDDQVKDLDRELQELHQYVLILEEDRRNSKLDVLTYIGAFFVVPSFIGTYFGINDFPMWEDGNWLAISAMCLMAALLVFGAIKSSPRRRLLWMVATVLFMVYVLVVYPYGKFG